MINEINIRNMETGEQITMGAFAPFVLDTIDWGSSTVEQTSYRVPYQIGQFQTGAVVGTRQPSITGYVIADIDGNGKTWEEYFNEIKTEINVKKMKLDKIFSIYQDVEIEANGYRLIGRPKTSVKYSTKEKENNDVLCMFSVTLQCFYPMFKKESKQVQLAVTEDMLHFPLILKQSGIPFGAVIRKRGVNITNNGDIDAGATIVVTAENGSVDNPMIYNLQTQETIEFEGVTLNKGDVLTITTETGEENIILHDSSNRKDVNVLGNMKIGSKLFKIKRGTYSYAYYVSDEQEGNVNVLIKFEEQYFNIKGM